MAGQAVGEHLYRRQEVCGTAVASLVRQARDPAVALEEKAREALEAVATHQPARCMDVLIDWGGSQRLGKSRPVQADRHGCLDQDTVIHDRRPST